MFWVVTDSWRFTGMFAKICAYAYFTFGFLALN